MLATARNALVTLGLGASAPAFGMDDSIFHDRPDPYPAVGAETRMAIAARTPPPVGGEDRWVAADPGERPTPATDAIPIIAADMDNLGLAMKWGFGIAGIVALAGGTAFAIAVRRRDRRQENVIRVIEELDAAKERFKPIREYCCAQRKIGPTAWKDVADDTILNLYIDILSLRSSLSGIDASEMSEMEVRAELVRFSTEVEDCFQTLRSVASARGLARILVLRPVAF